MNKPGLAEVRNIADAMMMAALRDSDNWDNEYGYRYNKNKNLRFYPKTSTCPISFQLKHTDLTLRDKTEATRLAEFIINGFIQSEEQRKEMALRDEMLNDLNLGAKDNTSQVKKSFWQKIGQFFTNVFND
ncbi:MAG: hypothetical protein ABIO44_08715 [Saprospiraceae bacterium]